MITQAAAFLVIDVSYIQANMGLYFLFLSKRIPPQLAGCGVFFMQKKKYIADAVVFCKLNYKISCINEGTRVDFTRAKLLNIININL